jgi:hypothetical protein
LIPHFQNLFAELAAATPKRHLTTGFSGRKRGYRSSHFLNFSQERREPLRPDKSNGCSSRCIRSEIFHAFRRNLPPGRGLAIVFLFWCSADVETFSADVSWVNPTPLAFLSGPVPSASGGITPTPIVPCRSPSCWRGEGEDLESKFFSAGALLMSRPSPSVSSGLTRPPQSLCRSPVPSASGDEADPHRIGT